MGSLTSTPPRRTAFPTRTASALIAEACQFGCKSAAAAMPGANEPGGTSTRTLLRGLAILDCFRLEAADLTLQQIVQMTGLPKATVFRLVHTLEAAGYLVHRDSQKYALSSKFGARTLVSADSAHLRAQALPVMRELAEASGHGVTLHTMVGNRRIWLDAVATEPMRRAIHYSNQPVPLCLGGATLVLLASMPPLELKAMLSSAAESSRCPPEELLAIVETTRRQGYAVSHGGGAAGITGIAAPIFTGPNGGLLCITIVLPTAAAKGKVADLVSLTLNAAQRISEKLA